MDRRCQIPGFNIPDAIKGCLDEHAFQGKSSYDGPDPNMEYARKHRWLLEFLEPFGSIKDGILLYAYKCNRPTPNIDEIVIHHGQDEIYRPGKNRWNPIEFSFYEKSPGDKSIVDETAERMYKWWGESVIILTQSIHGNINNYLKNGIVQMLDGVGKSIWEYHLYECWPTKITPSDLDYSDSNIADITITLRFNKAKETREKS